MQHSYFVSYPVYRCPLPGPVDIDLAWRAQRLLGDRIGARAEQVLHLLSGDHFAGFQPVDPDGT